MVTLKLSDEVLASLGLTAEATPEDAEKAIKDNVTALKETKAMSDLTMEAVDKLTKRMEAMEKALVDISAELPKDYEAKVREVAEATAKTTAAQEVSVAIAKAGTIQPAPAPQNEEKPALSIKQQFAAIKDPMERGMFWRQHGAELLKSL